jgi:twitching motility two-component system response regulator PilG
LDNHPERAVGESFAAAMSLAPMSADSSNASNGSMATDSAAPTAPEAAAAPAGAKILVIDDSNTIRRSAEIFLRQGGHEVVLAEDGFDALSKVNDHAPQLIFCDILMPRLDGYQTCAIIKRNPRFAGVPVIMLSSKDGLFDKARGRMVGSEEYLTKPFTKEQLLRAVEHFCPGTSDPKTTLGAAKGVAAGTAVPAAA